jgi:hypothetical protein
LDIATEPRRVLHIAVDHQSQAGQTISVWHQGGTQTCAAPVQRTFSSGMHLDKADQALQRVLACQVLSGKSWERILGTSKKAQAGAPHRKYLWYKNSRHSSNMSTRHPGTRALLTRLPITHWQLSGNAAWHSANPPASITCRRTAVLTAGNLSAGWLTHHMKTRKGHPARTLCHRRQSLPL